MSISIIENPDRNLWDSFLEGQHLSNLWQTFEYGEVYKACFSHISITRLLVLNDNTPEAIVQGNFSSFLGFGTTLIIREGPVISSNSGDHQGILNELLNALENFGVKKHIIKIQIWWPKSWESNTVFRYLGYEPINTTINYVVNLDFGIEGLWKHIHHNKRKNVKKALSKGVEVRETSDYEDIHKFLDLYLASAKRHNLSSPQFSWFEAIWKLRKQQTRIFFARWKRKDVSGVFTTTHGKTIYALSAGSLSEGFEARPNDMLHWKVMEWGCRQGFSKYHMGEVHPEQEQGARYRNIWRWKREWNGDLDVVQHYEKNISKYPLIAQIYKILKKS
jgi:hypothetical protein